VFVLVQVGEFVAASDGGAQFGGAFGQESVGGGLGDAQDVGVGAVQSFGCGFGDGGEESADGVVVPVAAEGWQQAALVQHFEAAHVQAEGAYVGGRFGLFFQDEYVKAV